MKEDVHSEKINLSSPLTFENSFRFPLQSKVSKREVIWGGVLLVILPGIGWLLNMGHRIRMVHNMHHGKSPWPAWNNYWDLFKHGLITFGGMVYYYIPSGILFFLSYYYSLSSLLAVGIFLFLVATVAIPGYMTHYCLEFDPAEIYNPFRAMKRVYEGGWLYWKAWSIALTALFLSFFGLLALVVGFFVTSVWFWQVAGFSFASVFSQKFKLLPEDE